MFISKECESEFDGILKCNITQIITVKKEQKKKFKTQELIKEKTHHRRSADFIKHSFKFTEPKEGESFSERALRKIEEHLSPKVINVDRKIQTIMSPREIIESLDNIQDTDGLTIHGIPIYVHTLIFFFLTPKEMCSLSLVNSSFLEASVNDDLWKFYCKNYLNIVESSSTSLFLVWRKTFISNYKE